MTSSKLALMPEVIDEVRKHDPEVTKDYTDEQLTAAAVLFSTAIVSMLSTPEFIAFAQLGPDMTRMYITNVFATAFLGAFAKYGALDIGRAAAFVIEAQTRNDAGETKGSIAKSLFDADID